MQERRIWFSILAIGILFQILAAVFMPLGLDAHVHSTYVSDKIADGDSTLDWGHLRIDGSNQSVAEEIPADDKWFVWHGIIDVWFTIFGISLLSLHILGLIISFSALSVVYFCTKSLWGGQNALALTAILSIYSPLVRSTGRLYQESIVILCATIVLYSIVKILRKENNKFWQIICLIFLASILSIKGLPVKYALYLYLPILSLELYRPRYKPVNNITLLAITVVISVILVWTRLGEIHSDLIIILPITIFIAGIVYLYIAVLLFTSNSKQNSYESDYLSLLSQFVFAGLCGYIAMLFLVEMDTLNASREIVQDRFSYIYRYVTVLAVPLWWAQMAKQKEPAIKLKENKNKSLMSIVIALMIIINSYILTFERGIEQLGEELYDEMEDGENILYIADPPLAMHRLYTLQITTDPGHDRNITAYWADESMNWSSILIENQISWVILTDDTTNYLDERWIIFETETSNDVYHLAE
ncbi:MAG: glycosyltransferase family 39 protein [Candidatus Poseidoniaceae archaeon]|tara:strand:+ start:14206 stop:15624 length:1419 start_codon:yes stop_codon:yes gene_type:complete